MPTCTARSGRRPRALLVNCALGALLFGLAAAAHADHRIGAGGVVSLAGGSISLGCTDLLVSGTLNFDSGSYRSVRNVTVLAGGELRGGTGTLRMSGSLSIAPGGLYEPQQLNVLPAPECGAAAAPQPLVVPTLGGALLAALGLLLFALGLARLPQRRTANRFERIKP